MSMAKVDAIREELDRLDAGGGDGIEADEETSLVRLYDTQVSDLYEPDGVLAALRALPNGAGFEATWEAIGRLTIVVP